LELNDGVETPEIAIGHDRGFDGCDETFLIGCYLADDLRHLKAGKTTLQKMAAQSPT
jgi:hypothetical protein